MAIGAFEQPELIEINGTLRLRKYDGRYELFLPGYQNPTAPTIRSASAFWRVPIL